MKDVRRTINESDSVEDYADLFTTNNSPYIGSEATEDRVPNVGVSVVSPNARRTAIT